MRAGWIVALEGPSASGKTTLARRVGALLGTHVEEEAFATLAPPPPLTYSVARDLGRLERRLLEAEADRWERVTKLARRGENVVLDTGPLGPLTYTYGLVREKEAPLSVLRSLLRRGRLLARAGRLGIPERTLYLDVPLSERARRARHMPATHPPELFDRHRRVGHWERRLLLGPWRRTLSVEPVRVRSGALASVTARRLARLAGKTRRPAIEVRRRASEQLDSLFESLEQESRYAGSGRPVSPAAIRS